MDDRRIERILEVVDTRDWIEDIDGKFRAVAGSGLARECNRCSREHEVHATVLLEGGVTAIVGTGCMQEASMKIEARRMAGRARTLARNRAEVEAVRARVTAAEKIEREVDALPRPEIIEVPADRLPKWAIGTRKGQDISRRAWSMGETIVAGDELTEERICCLEESWKNAELSRRGAGFVGSLRSKLSALEAHLARLERRETPRSDGSLD